MRSSSKANNLSHYLSRDSHKAHAVLNWFSYTRTMLQYTQAGFYCVPGDFYIDPWKPVTRAVITHAHGDHLHRGSESYLVARDGESITRLRLDENANLQSLPYGESITINGVKVSLHPAGHILGSAQVRMEYRGEVAVISGDYKRAPDPTCTPFEVVPCHTFVTEATFGLPIYRWQAPEEIFADVNKWWRANQEQGKASILFGYALGKAQRIMAGIDSSIGNIYTHGAVERLNQAYREAGVELPPSASVTSVEKADWSQALIIAPPSARGTPWTRRFGTHSTAFASGWMRIRGPRRRRAVDQGFVVSDHVDWASLMETIKATGAERVWVTHGYVPVVVRWLRENGYQADGFETRFSGEEAEEQLSEENEMLP
jgi:putative mRNA 3-end processing factor